jgi:hypothetical protein
MSDKLKALYAIVGWRIIVGIICAIIVFFTPPYIDDIIIGIEKTLGVQIFNLSPEPQK